MPTRNISLTKHLDRFVDRQIASGRYGNTSEIFREALRLLEEQTRERTAKLKLLRRAAQQGFDEIEQGQGIALKCQKAVDRFIAEIESEVVVQSTQFIAS